MSEILDYAATDRRLKFLEEGARINKTFREYVMKRLAAKSSEHESMSGEFNTLSALHARINQFLMTYGGKPIERNSPHSLDMISDFLLVIGAEPAYIIPPNDAGVAHESGTPVPAEKDTKTK